MTDHVYDDGLEPDPPPPHGMPICPTCGDTSRPPNLELLRSGPGFQCLDCDTVFDGEPGEITHPANRKRRALLEEERRHTPDQAAAGEHPLAQRAREIAANHQHRRTA